MRTGAHGTPFFGQEANLAASYDAQCPECVGLRRRDVVLTAGFSCSSCDTLVT